MDNQNLKPILEAALLAAGGELSLDQMLQMFEENSQPEKKQLREVLNELVNDYEGRGVQIIEVASGWRIQVRADYAPWVSKLWDEKPGRYSRALMETLALIAYRQPITRGEIEDVRGVSVSSNIIKTLTEREWIRVVGHRDVPGKPALYATTRTFLDYFNLKSLNDLPTLVEIRDLDSINQELELNDPDKLEQQAETEEPTGEQNQETQTPVETDEQENSVSDQVPEENSDEMNESADEISEVDETEESADFKEPVAEENEPSENTEKDV